MPLPSFELVLGGIGLLLLGMGLLTEGLKLAAGGKLHEWLKRSTSTRFRGLFAGFSMTAIVQSSSAVTLATIGFSNAGLLSLKQAAWLVFGSNVGTTVTGWLVSLIGLDFKIEAFALPFIGVGILVKLFTPNKRIGAVAGALAGFGVLFLGLSFLKSAFSDIGGVMSEIAISDYGYMAVVYALLVGAGMTAIMQSSSAAIAIIITAYAQGVFGETIGAALIIGANVGTTTTALLASIGATANAKRLALLHVIFNLQTALLAGLLLVPLLWMIDWLRSYFGFSGNSATTLALFHTMFNVLGVILMWPMANRVTNWVEKRFMNLEPIISKPLYLDSTVLVIPETGARAAQREIIRVGSMLALTGKNILDMLEPKKIDYSLSEIEHLLDKIAEFIAQLNRASMTTDVGASIVLLLETLARYRSALQDLYEWSELMRIQNNDINLIPPEMRQNFIDLINYSDPEGKGFSPVNSRLSSKRIHHQRRAQRQILLEQTANDAIDMKTTMTTLQLLTAMDNFTDHFSKSIVTIEKTRKSFNVNNNNGGEDNVDVDTNKDIENKSDTGKLQNNSSS